MAAPQRRGDLEIDEDIDHQRKVWVIERIAWRVMAVIIVAALLGLLGAGPLSNAVTDQPDTGLVIEYQRFARHKTGTLIAATLAPSRQENVQLQDARTRLRIGRRFFEDFQVSNVLPQPSSVEAWPDHFIYVFELPDQENAAEILFFVAPNKFGSIEASMTLEGYRELTFSQFVYP